LRAYGVEHLPLAALRSAISFARLAARDATRGLVLEAFLGVELLFAGRESEFGTAIATGQHPILKCHGSPSSVPQFGNATTQRPNGGCPHA